MKKISSRKSKIFHRPLVFSSYPEAISFFPKPTSAPLSSLAAVSNSLHGCLGPEPAPLLLDSRPENRCRGRGFNRHAFQFLFVAGPRFVSLIRRYPTFEFFSRLFPSPLFQRDRKHPIQKYSSPASESSCSIQLVKLIRIVASNSLEISRNSSLPFSNLILFAIYSYLFNFRTMLKKEMEWIILLM